MNLTLSSQSSLRLPLIPHHLICRAPGSQARTEHRGGGVRGGMCLVRGIWVAQLGDGDLQQSLMCCCLLLSEQTSPGCGGLCWAGSWGSLLQPGAFSHTGTGQKLREDQMLPRQQSSFCHQKPGLVSPTHCLVSPAHSPTPCMVSSQACASLLRSKPSNPMVHLILLKSGT